MKNQSRTQRTKDTNINVVLPIDPIHFTISPRILWTFTSHQSSWVRGRRNRCGSCRSANHEPYSMPLFQNKFPLNGRWLLRLYVAWPTIYWFSLLRVNSFDGAHNTSLHRWYYRYAPLLRYSYLKISTLQIASAINKPFNRIYVSSTSVV